MDTAGQACGDCGVTDDCIEASCLELGTFSTDQCPVGEGPGEDGDYLDPALTESTIASMPWSSSPVGDAASGDAWVMWFDGEIGVYPQAVNDLDLVRCVRAEP